MTILKACSKKVEDAVKELIALLRSTACLPTLHSFDTDDNIKAKKGYYNIYRSDCHTPVYIH